LIYQQKASDAFSDLRRTFRVTIAIMVLAGICIVLIAFVLSKRMVNRIAESDQEKELITEQVVETGKLASVGELAAGIAHEINNPLGIILGFVQDILEEIPADDPLFESIKIIEKETARCVEVVKSLFGFLRV